MSAGVAEGEDGRRRRRIDWQQPARGGLEATHSRLLRDSRSWRSKLKWALWWMSRRDQEAACPDPDAPSRAEHQGLERSYAAVSRPLSGLLLTSLVYNRTFSMVSHVPVATVGSSYEG